MFRNAVLAVVAVFGVNLAFLISGTVLVENVFSLPGLGTLLVNSVADRDYPVVQGVTLVFAVLIVGHQPAHRHRAGRARPAGRPGDRRMSTMLGGQPVRAADAGRDQRRAGRRRSVGPAAAARSIAGLAMLGLAIAADRAGAGAGQPVARPPSTRCTRWPRR